MLAFIFVNEKKLSGMESKHFLILFINIIALDCYAQSSFSLSECIADKNSAEPIVGATYDGHPNADIIHSPTSYWHVKPFADSKPVVRRLATCSLSLFRLMKIS